MVSLNRGREDIRLMLHNWGKSWSDTIYTPSEGISVGIKMFKAVNACPNTLKGASGFRLPATSQCPAEFAIFIRLY